MISYAKRNKGKVGRDMLHVASEPSSNIMAWLGDLSNNKMCSCVHRGTMMRRGGVSTPHIWPSMWSGPTGFTENLEI